MKSVIYRKTTYAFALFTFILLIAAMRVSANDPKCTTVSHATGKISIDGVLDEPDWVQAESIGRSFLS